MSAWWEAREPRERLLLGVLGALLGVFVLVFAVILPVMDARADADRALARAQADYNIVARTLPRAGAGSAERTLFSRSALLDAARAEGLQITRIQAGREGDLSVWIDDAQTTALYAMFDALLTDTTASMDRVVVSADGNGRLSAQFTVR